jgi:hypothetical protein
MKVKVVRTPFGVRRLPLAVLKLNFTVKYFLHASARDVDPSFRGARMRAGMHAFMQTIATSRKPDGKHARKRSGVRAVNNACHHAPYHDIAES